MQFIVILYNSDMSNWYSIYQISGTYAPIKYQMTKYGRKED